MSELVCITREGSKMVISKCLNLVYCFCLTCFMYPFLYVLPRLFVRFETFGQENVLWDGHVLYLIRHRNYVGTFAVQGCMFFHGLFFHPDMYPHNVAKLKHIAKLGRFGVWFAKVCKIYPLPERNNQAGRREIFTEEVRLLTDTRRVTLSLFPTGTRDKVGQTHVSPFQTAIGGLVKETRPIIIFVHDDDSFVFRRASLLPFWNRPTVRVTISKPLDLAEGDSYIAELCRKNADSKVIAEALQELYWLWSSTIDSKVTGADNIVAPDLELIS